MVLGSDRILYIRIDGVYTPIACLTSNSFSESIEELDTTVREDAGWRTFRPTNIRYEISFSGIQEKTEGDLSKISYDRLKGYLRGRTLIEWRLEGDDLIDYGKGYITSLSETADVGTFLSFDGTIIGWGQALSAAEGVAPEDNPPSTVVANILTASGNVLNTTLGWTAATDDFGITGYQVRVEGSDGRSEIVDLPVVLFYVEPIPDGVTYRYNVRAVDTIGQTGAWSNLVAQTGSWGVAVDSKQTQSGVTRRRQNGDIQQFQ